MKPAVKEATGNLKHCARSLTLDEYPASRQHLLACVTAIDNAITRECRENSVTSWVQAQCGSYTFPANTFLVTFKWFAFRPLNSGGFQFDSRPGNWRYVSNGIARSLQVSWLR